MTVVTVFRSRIRWGSDEAYAQVATEMSRIVRAMDGFLDEKIYVAPDGERVTIVRFRDAASQKAWAKHPDHLAAQRRGRDEFYSWYDISVGDTSYVNVFSPPKKRGDPAA